MSQGVIDKHEKTYSPTALAMRRLRQNKLAMLGLVLVVSMVSMVLVAPLFSETPPDETHTWIGPQPPGFTHPAVWSRNSFYKDGVAEMPAMLMGYDALTFTALREVRRAYRIGLRRGKVNSITAMDNAKAMTTLDLSQAKGTLVESLDSLEEGRTLEKAVVTTGQAPPAGWFKPKQRVLIVWLKQPGKEHVYEVALAGGVVKGIMQTQPETKPMSQLQLKGEDILSVSSGDKQLERTYLFGTDDLGRDLFMRICYGGRISLLVGLVATAVSLFIGVIYGAVAGFKGGNTDRMMMAGVDILYGLPFIFMVIILMVAFGRDLILLFIALGAVQWLTMARIVRGQVLSLKSMEYIEAARINGCSAWQIIWQHLIPHTLGPVIVYTTLTVPVVIMEESFLAFIGLSVQMDGKSLDSWGALVHNGVKFLGDNGENSWMLIFPSLAMVLTLFGLNTLGDGLRDSFDVRGDK